MNHPDINKIITDISHLIDLGMEVCLNVETGEFVERFPEESDNAAKADYETLNRRYAETVAKWHDTMVFSPIDSGEEYDIMQYFISDNVREGTALHRRLTEAIKADNPYEAFAREIELCKGQKQWDEYRESSLYAIVKCDIAETLGMPCVKVYPLNDETIRLMNEARLNGRYCYVHGDEVIISQVVTQQDMDIQEDKWIELDTHYSIREWAIQTAEERLHFDKGGGMVYEPIDPEDERDDEELTTGIQRGIEWMEELDRDFDQFCAEQQMIDDLWDAVGDYPDDMDDPDAPQIEFITPSKERKTQPDGKFPIHGLPDDCFSDDDPWGRSDIDAVNDLPF